MEVRSKHIVVAGGVMDSGRPSGDGRRFSSEIVDRGGEKVFSLSSGLVFSSAYMSLSASDAAKDAGLLAVTAGASRKMVKTVKINQACHLSSRIVLTGPFVFCRG